MDRRPVHSGDARHQYRRFVPTLDQRHLSLKSAPRGQPDWEGTLLDPNVLQSRLLHPSVVPTDLPIGRQSAEVPTDQIRRLFVEPIPGRAEISRRRRLAQSRGWDAPRLCFLLLSFRLVSHLDVASDRLLLNGLVVKIVGTFKEIRNSDDEIGGGHLLVDLFGPKQELL